MTIGELKKKLENYPDNIEIYAAPMVWVPTIGDESFSQDRIPNILEKHKTETFEVRELRPAPGFEGPTTVSACIGFNENIERIPEMDFESESDTIN